MGVLEYIQSFKEKNKILFLILRIIFVLISTGITLYMVVISMIRYEKYANRPDFRLEIVNNTVTRKTYFYIVRSSANISQCSSKAQFEENVTSLYEALVRKPDAGIFHAVFWLNFIVAMIVNAIDLAGLLQPLRTCGESDDERKFYWCIFDRTFLRIMVATMITPPTYYISAFDFSKACLEIRTNADIGAFTYLIAIAIVLPVLGISILTIVWIANCVSRGRLTITFRPSEIYEKHFKNTRIRKLIFFGCLCYCGYSCLYLIGVGCFFWYLMIIAELTRVQGIMIVIFAFF